MGRKSSPVMVNVFASLTSSGVVTPSDTTELDFKVLWIGVAGNVTVAHTATGTPIEFPNVPGGWFEFQGVIVHTDTTADGIRWGNW